MKLADEEQELLRAELASLLAAVPEGPARASYRTLLASVDEGDVPDEQVGTLEGLLAVGLESGRTRAVHSAHGEMTAQKLFQRTPGGRALRSSSEAVSQALQALEGHTIEEISVTASGPGSLAISLGTDHGRVLIRLDRRGARIQSLEVGS